MKIVRRRMSRLNSAGWNSDLMPSGARSGVLWSFSKRIRRHRSIVCVTSTASASCPFSANQRGLSGTLRRRMMITSAGTIPKPSIHRHDVSYGSASRMTTPTIAPSSMPTACSENAETSHRPRFFFGRISARNDAAIG